MKISRFSFVDESGEDDDNTKMLFKRKFHLKEKDNITNKIYIRQLFDVHSLSLESIVCLDIYYKCRTLAFMQVVR